jgi:hypothetical protein
MFTITTTFTNTTGSWNNLEEATAIVNDALALNKTEEDKIKLDDLARDGDHTYTYTLTDEGTVFTIISQANQHALDVFDGLSEFAGSLVYESHIVISGPVVKMTRE